jgi:hypothetical protein
MVNELPNNELHGAVSERVSKNSPAPTVTDPPSHIQHHTAVVIQHLDGKAHLLLVILHSSLNAENYMRKIQEEYQHALCKVKRPPWNNLFTRHTIGTAHIHQVRVPT